MIYLNEVTSYLLRGPRPKNMADLKTLGVTDILNLQHGFHEFFNNDEYENQLAANFGMVETELHFGDLLPPSRKSVGMGLEIIRSVRDMGGRVYVHCLHGKDRTGFMIACFRMIDQGWSFEKARDEMFMHGFHKWPYYPWTWVLKDYAHFRRR